MKIERSLSQALSAVALSASLMWTGNALAAPSCKEDVAKFCPQVQPGAGRIGQCLKQNDAQLSASCKERMKMVAARMKEVKQACADDVQQYYAVVKPGGGRVANCLKQHKDQLSTECKTEIADLLEKK